jgi:uncharacterized protein (TIGR00645 family)
VDNKNIISKLSQVAEKAIFSSRWLLWPINFALTCGLVAYTIFVLKHSFVTIFAGFHEMESLMLFMLSLVDAAMVANLIVMIVIGGHQIFISKFDFGDEADSPQFLDHLDTGILKVKVALSVCGITLIQLLKDFFNVEKVDWIIIVHRAQLHGLTLLSALVVAIIWRLMHSNNKA